MSAIQHGPALISRLAISNQVTKSINVEHRMGKKQIKIALAVLVGCTVVAFLVDPRDTNVNAQETQADTDQTKATAEQRFFMLNALWFKEDGGAEKYQEYLKAAGPFVAKHGGKTDRAYIPETSLIGKFDADLVFFVEWPNQKAFADFVQDSGYQAIRHLREEAIRDSLLIRCRSM
jgi:uncharacterized protein (DUF1330 family)